MTISSASSGSGRNGPGSIHRTIDLRLLKSTTDHPSLSIICTGSAVQFITSPPSLKVLSHQEIDRTTSSAWRRIESKSVVVGRHNYLANPLFGWRRRTLAGDDGPVRQGRLTPPIWDMRQRGSTSDDESNSIRPRLALA